MRLVFVVQRIGQRLLFACIKSCVGHHLIPLSNLHRTGWEPVRINHQAAVSSWRVI
jgi:hypothetical protein